MSSKSKRKPFAKRSFGQNFLVDNNYIDRIVSGLEVGQDRSVIEIGAGRGALTEALLQTGADILAIEIDRDLHPLLRERFQAYPNFRLIADDVLQVDFSTVFADAGIVVPATLVGNLPYNISTVILERVISARQLFSRAVFMFQREVVERITALPGNSERGYYTVLVEAAFDSEHLFNVPPTAFSPRPKVNSAVVSLVPKPASVADDQNFRKLISVAFAQKRKTIYNNLRNVYPDVDKGLLEAEIDPKRRAETLTLDEWYLVYQCLTSQNHLRGRVD